MADRRYRAKCRHLVRRRDAFGYIMAECGCDATDFEIVQDMVVDVCKDHKKESAWSTP